MIQSQKFWQFHCFSRNGKFVMTTKDSLVLYSSKGDAFEYLPIHGGELLPYYSVDIKTYVDSLITPNAMNESEQ